MREATVYFGTLSDDQLLVEAKRLVGAERRATAALLESLMELDARRLYLREGCSSLFTYCTQVLHLAEGAAYNRIEAARAARKYPLVLEALATGAITLTTARLLAPHLTEQLSGTDRSYPSQEQAGGGAADRDGASKARGSDSAAAGAHECAVEHDADRRDRCGRSNALEND